MLQVCASHILSDRFILREWTKKLFTFCNHAVAGCGPLIYLAVSRSGCRGIFGQRRSPPCERTNLHQVETSETPISYIDHLFYIVKRQLVPWQDDH